MLIKSNSNPQAPVGSQNGDSMLVELIPGGSKIPVTQQRVREYVRYVLAVVA
jgi:hypothetical protein